MDCWQRSIENTHTHINPVQVCLSLWHQSSITPALQKAKVHLKRGTTARADSVYARNKLVSKPFRETSAPSLDYQGENRDVHINTLTEGWKPQRWPACRHSEQWTQHIFCPTVLDALSSQDVLRRGGRKCALACGLPHSPVAHEGKNISFVPMFLI